jgi:hypothetical protein
MLEYWNAGSWNTGMMGSGILEGWVQGKIRLVMKFKIDYIL